MCIAQRGECLRRARDARFSFRPYFPRVQRNGYCRSLYFQKLLHVRGRRGLRAEREKSANSRAYVYYVQHPRQRACTCVRCCTFNLGSELGQEDGWWFGREKNLSRAMRFVTLTRIMHSPRSCHVLRKRGNCLRTHFRRRSKKALLSLFSIRLFVLLSPFREDSISRRSIIK